jgi:predicted DNA-binding transcriptional regulator
MHSENKKLQLLIKMSRDQVYGATIFLISLAIAIIYVIAFFPQAFSLPMWWHEIAVGFPVLLFVLAVLVISMWIGWTMMTTPPPAPLETELSSSMESEKEKNA